MIRAFSACLLALGLGLVLPAGAAVDEDEIPPDIRLHPAVLVADWDAVTEVVVELGDHRYEPEIIELKVGQPYRLILKNIGAVSHDMVGGSLLNPNVIALRMVSSRVGRILAEQINSVYVRTKNSADLWFVPLVAGEYTFYCSLPTHREEGMEGVVRIVE